MRGESVWRRKVPNTGGKAFDKDVSTEALWMAILMGTGTWPLSEAT